MMEEVEGEEGGSREWWGLVYHDDFCKSKRYAYFHFLLFAPHDIASKISTFTHETSHQHNLSTSHSWQKILHLICLVSTNPCQYALGKRNTHHLSTKKFLHSLTVNIPLQHRSRSDPEKYHSNICLLKGG